MRKILETLVARDGVTFAEAKRQLVAFCEEMEAGIDAGGEKAEWEESFCDEFGLEPDYFDPLAFVGWGCCWREMLESGNF